MFKKFMGHMLVIFSLLVALPSIVFAESAADPMPASVPDEISKQIVDRLKKARPDLNFGGVEPTPIKGLYLIRIDGTQFIYVSESGEYVISGDMYRARPGLFVPVKDLAAASLRKRLMGSIAKEDTIVFSPSGETKAVLYVFTDVDCHYCRKLHNESVPELNENGVEVRYLAYPRAGLDSDSFRKVASAWCAKDKSAALTALKRMKPIAENVCDDNPVAAQFSLGHKVGVTGTPALVMEDGTLMPGYRPAQELLKIIGVN